MTAFQASAAVKRFIEWPWRNPGVTFLFLVILAVLATVLAGRLSIGRASAGARAVLVVTADMPGIDSARVEAALTRPLEAALQFLDGAARSETRTRAGRATLTWYFVSASARDRALDESRRRIAALLPSLLPGVTAPIVEARDLVPPAVIYAVTGDDTLAAREQWVERALATPMRELPEVGAVVIEGGLDREIVIEPDVRRLAALGLSFDDLSLALRGNEQTKPSRRARARRSTATPGSAEAIAARAVRLPSGESIAMAEVAAISVRETAQAEPFRLNGVPALRLIVYPRAATDAARIAERSNAHLAWLRANELVPPDVAVHALHDEFRESRQWLKQLGQRAAVLLAVTLLACAFAYGVRQCGFLVGAIAIWLPVSLASLWFCGFSLNAMSACGLTLAAISFIAMVATPWFAAIALVSMTAALLAWTMSGSLVLYRTAALAFATTSAAGVVVAWLLTPWMSRRSAAASIVRWLPAAWKDRADRFAASFVVAAIFVAASANAGAIATLVEAPVEGGALVVRAIADDTERAAEKAEPLLVQLQTIAGRERVSFSAAAADAWRLELDSDRVDELGLNAVEIGRAFAVARDGLIAGDIVHGDVFYRLRLQLPTGAAGQNYARLLIRGERRDGAPIYLQDVGIALQDVEPRERLTIDGKPAVEIAARWRDDAARDALVRFCAEIARQDPAECRFEATLR